MAKYFLSIKTTALVMAMVLTLAACTPREGDAPVTGDTGAVGATVGAAADDGPVTIIDLGVPRHETLIIESITGTATNLISNNPFHASWVNQGIGARQFLFEPLWEVDSVNGRQIPLLAAGMPEPLDDTYTRFSVALREGVRWNDGVEFTAEDLVFTSEMLLSTPEFPFSAAFGAVIRSITAIDSHTVLIETHNPETRLEQFLGVTVTLQNFQVVPRHIWAYVDDVATFTNPDMIHTGPYLLKDFDPHGNWFLFERREDHQYSATSIVMGGTPAPRYIVFRAFGTEELRIMAAIQNQVDMLFSITPESWEVLQRGNPGARAWHSGFPYATMNDPGGRGILFNTASSPMDNVNVRWALLLAIDLHSVSLSTFSGMLRASPIILAPTDALSAVYHRPMTPRFMEFEFEDGFRPFNENFAVEMVETLRRHGVENLPEDPQTARDLFGVGWWRHDPEQAERMLIAEGFSRNAAGNWLLPDGSLWQVSLAVPSGFEVIAERMGFGVVDQWQRFGIDAVAVPGDVGTFHANISTGAMDASIAWPSMSVIADGIGQLRHWHSRNVVPVGQSTPTGWNSGASSRFQDATIDRLIDEIAGLPAADPRVIELTSDLQWEIARNAVFGAMFGTSMLVPTMGYYWDGIQSADNPHEGPWWWWSNFRFSPYHYSPTGRR